MANWERTLSATFAEDGDESLSLTHDEVEIADAASVRRTLEKLQPQVIVNTSAMHHVENCELDPEKAYRVNALGARNLAEVARDLGAVLIHVSTDYVFDGNKRTPYEETDCPRPLNVYGNTKLAGEYFVRCGAGQAFHRADLRALRKIPLPGQGWPQLC